MSDTIPICPFCNKINASFIRMDDIFICVHCKKETTEKEIKCIQIEYERDKEKYNLKKELDKIRS